MSVRTPLSGPDREQRAWEAQEQEIRARRARLTPREMDVTESVVKGQANKLTAMVLGVSQRTLELHRARVVRKRRMRSLAELASAIDKLSPQGSAPSAAAAPR